MRPLTPRLSLALLLTLATAVPLAALEPVSPPLRLDDGGTCRESDAGLARLGDGGFVAVWVQAVEPDEDPEAPLRVHARLFDADGTPRAAPFVVDGTAPQSASTPAVAAADGGFLVAWVEDGSGAATTAHARAFAADGTPRGAAFELGVTGDPGDVDVTAAGDGYRLIWVHPDLGLDSLVSRTVDVSGTSGGDETLLLFSLPPENRLDLRAPRVAADGRGFSLAHRVTVEGPFGARGPEVDAYRFRSHDAPHEPLPLAVTDGDEPEGELHFPPAVGTAADGTTVVVWRQAAAVGAVRGLRARVFTATGTPRTDPLWLTGPGGWTRLSDPALAVAADGSFQVAWAGRRLGATDQGLYAAAFGADGEPVSAPRRVGDGFDVPDTAPDLLRLGGGELLLAWHDRVPTPGVPGVPPCFSSGILARRLSTEVPDELALHDGRFAVRVDWDNPYSAGPESGTGRAVPLNDESGWFWFFRPGNAELVVKVLDGRFTNGHWWVFHGGLSTVAYRITVTDLATDRTWSYDKAPFERVSGADTRAFPADDAVVPPPLGGAVAPSALRAPAGAADTAPDSPAGPCTDPSLPVVIRPGLCLHERFEVEVEFDDPLFAHNQGAAPVSTDTGRLWFFRPDNTELLVKVLDGRPVNGRWWVFSGALTNVGYTLVVRDTASGAERRYPVPERAFRSIADTEAFAGSAP